MVGDSSFRGGRVAALSFESRGSRMALASSRQGGKDLIRTLKLARCSTNPLGRFHAGSGTVLGVYEGAIHRDGLRWSSSALLLATA